MSVVRTLLIAVGIVAASVWVGSLVCLALVANVSRKVLGPGERVELFRRVGRVYGIVGTGSLLVGKSTVPAGTAERLAEQNFEGDFERPRAERPFNIELALVFEDVEAAFASAIENGASALREPHVTQWGQTVAYVRDPFGTLIELATPTD